MRLDRLTFAQHTRWVRLFSLGIFQLLDSAQGRLTEATLHTRRQPLGQVHRIRNANHNLLKQSTRASQSTAWTHATDMVTRKQRTWLLAGNGYGYSQATDMHMTLCTHNKSPMHAHTHIRAYAYTHTCIHARSYQRKLICTYISTYAYG